MGLEKVDDNVYLVSGKIRDQVGEYDCLHIGGDEVASVFSKFVGKIITLRYWVFNRAVLTVEEATELMLEDMFSIGGVSAKCVHNWSEITGYLYTTEECIIGGHDMLHQLKGYMGKHVLMEVTINQGVDASFYLDEPIKQLTSTEFLMDIIRNPPSWKGTK